MLQKKSKASMPKGETKRDRFNQCLDNLLQLTLLWQSRVVEPVLPIPAEDFTIEKLKKVTSKVNNNISWGIDNIPAELRKSGILNERLLHICNYVDSQQEIDTWKKKSTLHYSPQNEGLLLTTNYRGITLTPIAAKIDPKLKNRIRPFLLALLRKNQYGF